MSTFSVDIDFAWGARDGLQGGYVSEKAAFGDRRRGSVSKELSGFGDLAGWVLALI
jgi:hypothetical protein